MSVRGCSFQVFLIAFWLLAAGGGFAVIYRYQNTTGEPGATPVHWPARAQLEHDAHRATLVMFVHPQCPCTRASIEELNHLLAQVGDHISAEVLFLKPKKLPSDWDKTDLWRSAMAIPGVKVAEDLDGVQANIFGAETSGSVLLYDTRGRLLFKGGITASRGHIGDNVGEDAVISLCQGHAASLNQAPVYGCSLFGGAEVVKEESAQ
jgi:hypothetical protein